MESVKIIDTNEENVGEFSMCGYKNPKIEGYKRKIQWLKNRFSEGMKYKILYSQNDGAVGGIEFIPGEYSWRPVTAKGYFVIHCIFIMSRKYKDNSYGSLLLNDCLEDARKENMLGVAVVTRKGTWMAGRELFIKNGFEIVDKAPPDFELLVRKFRSDSPTPKFKGQWEMKLDKFGEGLFILTSDQCPYTHKAVKEISETAENVIT